MLAHEKFEKERIGKAEKLTGKKGIKADSFGKFLAERCEICPHSLLTSLSYYWLETICLFDGEMSLTLPAPAKETPALFFDALSIIRHAKKKASDEDKKD